MKNLFSFKNALIVFLNLFFCFYVVELAARFYISKSHDGIVWLKSPTPNYEQNDELGWFSIPNLKYDKVDSCFGSGEVSYNNDGFRSKPFTKRGDYDIVVVILGDSTVQSYQIPDGQHMSDLLQKKLSQKYKNPYVVGMGVGGYGTAQQYLMLKKFYKKYQPDYIFHLWDKNDLENNSYEWEKIIGSGHNLQIPRPYLNQQTKSFEIKRPMPLYLGSHFTFFKIIKKLNKTINNLFVDIKQLPEVKKKAKKTTTELISMIKKFASKSVFTGMYFSYAKDSIHSIYEELNIPYIELPNMDDKRCLPKDYHINPQGHDVVAREIFNVITK